MFPVLHLTSGPPALQTHSLKDEWKWQPDFPLSATPGGRGGGGATHSGTGEISLQLQVQR